MENFGSFFLQKLFKLSKVQKSGSLVLEAAINRTKEISELKNLTACTASTLEFKGLTGAENFLSPLGEA